ncbi:MAG: SDR family oxidoreductase [Rhodospirillaceae bacterium]|nr:SDR family oxidoreductase [Rhodospirillaceae bacterium]
MKNVVITGSTKGIGYGYAHEFVRRGHNVFITGRGADDLTKALNSLSKDAANGARVAGAPCDVADVNQVQAAWDQTTAMFGKIDIWINNAGFARTGVTLLQLAPDEMKTMIESNVIGTINGSQVAVRGMQAQNHGTLFNTLGGGHDGRVIPGMIGYGTTKRAVRYFTDSLIKELGKDSAVKVCMISPGVNITEGMLREVQAMPPAERKKALWPINVMGDYVETTTPWLVDQMLATVAAGESGKHIAWLTGGKIAGRFLTAGFKKRDLFARYGLSPA